MVVHDVPGAGAPAHGPRLQPRRRRPPGRAQPPDGALRSARSGEVAVHSVRQLGGAHMRRSVRWTVVASVVTALAMVAAACGSSNDNGGSAGASKTTAGNVVKQGKQGGKLTMLEAGDVDYIDPGQTYYQWGYAVHYVD